jgi:hypothetical protein
MKPPMKNRDLLLLLKKGDLGSKTLEKELISLDKLLTYAESPITFCKAYELAGRFGLTDKKEKLLTCYRKEKLQPFNFLICKN